MDGIAAPVRSSYSQTELLARVEFLNIISSRLKYLADKYELTCITTNQVTSKMIENDKAVDSHLEAALGKSCTFHINTVIVQKKKRRSYFQNHEHSIVSLCSSHFKLIPNFFSIFDCHFSLSLSFLVSQLKCFSLVCYFLLP